MLQLTPEQVRTMTLEEKDTWWLKNVYRGDMPQLTWRSAITGMLLGSVLVLTNFYIGIKTGFAAGVGITSVIIAFAAWKFLSKLRLGKEMTILENNAIQSIATAAGYMGSPLVASMVAYMVITNTIFPMWQMITWMIGISLLGVLYAFPLKKKFINDEQHPFPEGKACGLVLEGLHSEKDSKESSLKSKMLFWITGLTMFYKLFSIPKFLNFIKAPFLEIPGFLDDFVYKLGLVPTILGIPFKNLTFRLESDPVLYALGGLMGIRTGVSILIGGIINYLILAPIMMKQGVIADTGGFRAITAWSLWGGVAMMTTASLLSFFSKPKMLLQSFSGLFRKSKKKDVLAHIELPMKVFVIGIPIVGLALVIMGHFYFDMKWWLGALAIPTVFIFAVIAVHSTALTSFTPMGALAKITQLSYAVIAPGNITTNIAAASITSDVAANASNLLMDIKPGYMLGGKPRHQAMGHVLGIIVGAIFSAVMFYLLLNNNLANLMTEKMPMPSATVWKAVAELLSKGFAALHPTAVWAVIFGGLAGIVLEIMKIVTKGKFFVSAVGVGLAATIPFFSGISMFLGALTFWILEKCACEEGKLKKVVLANSEIICAGLIAGGSIMGLIGILLET